MVSFIRSLISHTTWLLLLAFTSLFSAKVGAQSILREDLDGDGITDTVRLNQNSWQLEVKLSSGDFKPEQSAPGLEHSDTETTYLSKEKDGFSYNVGYMRASFSLKFNYDKLAHQIRLTSYEEWNASSGKSGADEFQLNLLTGRLAEESTYWDEKKNDWEDDAPIREKLYYPAIYLSNITTELIDFFRDEHARVAWDYSDEVLGLLEDSLTVSSKQQYTWLGKLENRIPVFISFQISSDAYGGYGKLVMGQITYLNTKERQPIPLWGYKDTAGQFFLREYAPSGEITGILTLNEKGQILRGEWNKPYSFQTFKLKAYSMGILLPAADYSANPKTIFGSYYFQYGKDGPQGNVELKKLDNQRATLSLFSVTGAPGRNIAESKSDTIPLPQSDSFIHKVPDEPSNESSCKVNLHFYKNFVVVTYPDDQSKDCPLFGHNATLEGIYYKVK